MPTSMPQLFEALTRVRSAWPKRGWSFDNRFSCVASTFNVDVVTEARAALAHALPHSFGDKTLVQASPVLQEIAKRTGGVRAAQAILTGDPIGRITPYGLWWPWDDGRTISMRIGLESALQDSITQLCNTFGCEP